MIAWSWKLLQRQAFNCGPAYSFKGLIHYHHDAEHGDSHGWHVAGEIVEKYIFICSQIEKEREKQNLEWILKPQSPPPVTYFLQ